MEARIARAAVLVAALASMAASHRTPNFVVEAPTPDIARQVGEQAEKFRHDLAVEWLAKPMPNWSQPCPITVQVGDHLGAGGATSFVFNQGEVFGWQMNIQGPLDRVLDSVLPHEVTHTIFASHFRRPLPRWADEGGCTTVEHDSERMKQQKMLIAFLRTGRGIAFSQMFAMKEYPRDILPLYAQGHSLASFLMSQGGKQKFLNYLAEGMESEEWVEVTARHYVFASLGVLQNTWLDWVRRGSPPIRSEGPDKSLIAAAGGKRSRPEPNLIVRAQSADPQSTAATSITVPVNRNAPSPAPASEAWPTDNAAAANNTATPPAARNWYPAGNRQASAAPASNAPASNAPSANVLPHPGDQASLSSLAPQNAQRRTILEWKRPDSIPGEPAAAAPPSAPATTASVYDTGMADAGVIRR